MSVNSIQSTSRLFDGEPPIDRSERSSAFRAVFRSEGLRGEFVKFLQTIFYQLDSGKVLEQMQKILADPAKSDESIYEELVSRIDQMRHQFPSVFYQLKSLFVLQKGMGQQAQTLLGDFRGQAFHDYLEVYFRRYHQTLQKTADLALDGQVFSMTDQPHQGSFKERLEAGVFLGSYPYQQYIALNDIDCARPEMEPEKTHRPIPDDALADNKIDLIGCLGGLHHIPEARVGPFVDAMHKKLKPGGVILLRDHDASSEELKALVSVVHSFVNAASGVPWNVENREIRCFKSGDDWKELMKKHDFIHVPKELLVLQDDPTNNGMMAFVKPPQNVEELKIAGRYRKDCFRSADSTRATWIEWGNVRYAKQFAQFTQTKHSYAFDYIGHLRQHYSYFTHYLDESRHDLGWKEIICSDNFAMNLFILGSTTLQCLTGYVGSLHSIAWARCRQGVNWRNATDLSSLERYEASVEMDYSSFIDHTPAYMFPYLSKIRGLWQAIMHAEESCWVKSMSCLGGVSSTMNLLVKAAICAPVRMLYTTDGQPVQADRVAILIKDPLSQINQGGFIAINGQQHQIEVVYETLDNHKLVLMPSYRPFTDFCKDMPEGVELIEVGGQSTVTLDVEYQEAESTVIEGEGLRLIYELPRLQDDLHRRYATYQIPVEKLHSFIKQIGREKIEYVHE